MTPRSTGPRAATPPPTTEAVVDLDAIGANIRLIAAATGTPVMAVVKADGFGHGLVPVARAALAHGATWLGVTSAAEALELRAAGLDAPMLTWLHPPDEDFVPLLRAGVDVSVSSLDHLAGVAASAARAGTPAWVHLKVDTGMSRNGALPDDWPRLVADAHQREKTGRIRVRGVWTHLAGADEPGASSVDRQLAAFEAALRVATAAGLHPELRHAANSAGALAVPASHYDLVRIGIACYGVEPVHARSYGLRPAMTLRARAVLVKRVPAGTEVSYGGEYTTPRETTLVLVPLGYADGVPRRAATTARVWIGGRRHRIAGRISMDQFVVDVGDTPVATGDEVVLFGPGDRGEPTVAEWAAWAETNPHEILTRIGPRVPRTYPTTTSDPRAAATTRGAPRKESLHA